MTILQPTTRRRAPGRHTISPGANITAASPRSASPQRVQPDHALVPEPATTEAPRRPSSFRATAVLPIAGVACLAGLLIWGAVGNLGPSATRSWERVPAGQPYAAQPATPKVPPAASASSTERAPTTAAALPPMVDTALQTQVTLRIDPPPLGGTYGSDGEVQDNYSPAFFSVPAGKTIHVRVENYDTVAHTFTAPMLGLNVWIHRGGSHPSVTSFSFTAPSAGNYFWFCAIPCDPYSMATPGYMEGEVRAIS